jgi:hypothetical protein
LRDQRRVFIEVVKSEVHSGVEEAQSFKGERVLSLQLPKENIQISRVFGVLQEQRLKGYGILEWSIAQTSLNEVFLKIVEDAEKLAAPAQG